MIIGSSWHHHPCVSNPDMSKSGILRFDSFEIVSQNKKSRHPEGRRLKLGIAPRSFFLEGCLAGLRFTFLDKSSQLSAGEACASIPRCSSNRCCNADAPVRERSYRGRAYWSCWRFLEGSEWADLPRRPLSALRALEALASGLKGRQQSTTGWTRASESQTQGSDSD
jgi:hypothetical protein